MSVWRWVERYRQRGHLRPDPSPGCPSWTERERIFRLLEGQPDLSVRALQRALATDGAVFSIGALYRFLKHHGLQRRHRVALCCKPAPKIPGG